MKHGKDRRQDIKHTCKSKSIGVGSPGLCDSHVGGQCLTPFVEDLGS